MSFIIIECYFVLFYLLILFHVKQLAWNFKENRYYELITTVLISSRRREQKTPRKNIFFGLLSNLQLLAVSYTNKEVDA